MLRDGMDGAAVEFLDWDCEVGMGEGGGAVDQIFRVRRRDAGDEDEEREEGDHLSNWERAHERSGGTPRVYEGFGG